MNQYSLLSNDQLERDLAFLQMLEKQIREGKIIQQIDIPSVTADTLKKYY